MQALTGLFARQFGTPNYAAHGGFCSVNMAAGMIYTIGGSFWEFGGPDLERAKLFVMIGTAEDHHCNPLKIAISKFKRAGGRFISINPVRTGYSAIADEWMPIRPGTDGALLLALMHELIAPACTTATSSRATPTPATSSTSIARATRYGLLGATPASGRGHGNPNYPHNKLWWDRSTRHAPVVNHTPRRRSRRSPATSRCPTARRVKPAFQLLRERVRDCTPEWAAGITGIPAATHPPARARDGRHRARRRTFELPIAVDRRVGQASTTTVTRQPGRVPRDARARRALQRLPDDARARDPDVAARHDRPPRRLPPQGAVPARTSPPNCRSRPTRPTRSSRTRRSARRRSACRRSPTISSIDDDGTPVRIDKAFSWEYPLSVHGLMHNVITNAWRGDPYRIDTLHDLHGEHGVELDDEHGRGARDAERPATRTASTRSRSSSCATRSSREMTAFADLVLPDTTYLERHDVMSHARPADLRVRRPGRLGARSGRAADGRVQAVPGSAGRAGVAAEVSGVRHTPTARASSRDYPDFVVNFETEPGSGIGFLPGWRGKDGDKLLRGEPNPKQWEMYAQNNCVFHYHLPRDVCSTCATGTAGYLDWAQRRAAAPHNDPIQLAALFATCCRRSASPRRARRRAGSRPSTCASASRRYFDPLPFWYPPLEDAGDRPRRAIRSPRSRSGRWRCTTRGIRRTRGCARSTAHNYLYVNPRTAQAAGIADGGWMLGRDRSGARCAACAATARRSSRARCGPGTRSARRAGAWRLAPDANESQRRLPAESPDHRRAAGAATAARISNSDPVTGPGRLVRRARAHLPGRAPTSPRRRRRSSRRCRAVPGTRCAALLGDAQALRRRHAEETPT